MSNIPFNTIASILGTTTVQSQAANAIDRKKNEAMRTQRVQSVQSQRHTEEVEDPGEYSLDSIQEEHKGEGHSQQKRQPAAKVEIEGVDAEAGEEKVDGGLGNLDISA